MKKLFRLKSGLFLEMVQMENAESPETWGNDLFLVYDHRQLRVMKEGFEPIDIFEYLEHNKNLDSEEIDDRYDDYFIFPVDAYIHSGIHLSLGSTVNYPDRRWDVSTTGYVLVKKDSFDYPKWREKYHAGKSDEEVAKVLAQGSLNTWNKYLSGDVWGMRILKQYVIHEFKEETLKKLQDMKLDKFQDIYNYSDGKKIEYEELDSCWGFYGSDPEENGMIDWLDEGDGIIEE